MVRSPNQLWQDLLVIRAQSGDRKALEELVLQWQDRLWMIALKKLNDRNMAWDAVQDAWLAIIQGLHKLREPEAFGRWATTIVSNIAANSIRRKRRHTLLLKMRPQKKDKQNKLMERLADCHVQDILSPSQKKVITFYYLDRKRISEIAEMLNLPCGTVKSRLHYARKKLKHYLEINHV